MLGSFSILHSFRLIPRSSSFSFHSATGFGKETVDRTMIDPDLILCPCQSDLSYSDCCQKFHNKTALPSSLQQMVRSRFSGYALKNIPYIMETTHPTHTEYVSPEQQGKRKNWERKLRTFTLDYDFKNITFPNPEKLVSTDTKTGYIEFIAYLQKKTPNQSVVAMHESSKFIYSDGRPLYSGQIYHRDE